MKKPSRTSRRPPRAAPPPAPAAERAFSIVGIGASAGGLEALEVFFKNVPAGSGMGFVVVQHMDPTRKGMLAELLQRSTAMPVVQITDRMKVEPDHVFVIPPNCDLSILHGVLHLLEPAAPRGLRLPIDFFLRSLAADQQDRAIGVVLSGMGSDGTLGLRALKERAGGVFVQSPASAKFDSMPRSAIEAGLADVVAPAAELADKIVAYLRHVPALAVRPAPDLDDTDQAGLEKVVLLLRAHTGHDFSLYKKTTIYRRIERRMGLHLLPRIIDYVRYLRENPMETELLFKELLIGVTTFFRDPATWEQLEAEVIPALLEAHPDGARLRAWSPGCSTGEEAYSLAMVFREAIEQSKSSVPYTLQVFATDLDKDAIDKARTGIYPANIAADVSEARLRRFFVQEERGYRLSKEIREMVTFAPQNLVMDPPFTRLDLLTCRNLLIYLEADLQKKLMPLFHYALNPGGVLLLGSSETVGHASDLFTPMAGKGRFYKREATTAQRVLVEFPASFGRHRADEAAVSSRPLPSPPNLQALTDALMLERHCPAAVLATDKGDIVYFSGKTGPYLEPAAGKANLNLFAMARDGLSHALADAFSRAVREKGALTLRGIAVKTHAGTKTLDVTVQPLTEPAGLRGMVLVVFIDVPTPPPSTVPDEAGRGSVQGARMTELTHDLQRSRAELQSAREEMQTSLEEIRSANEELQSTNEELQSCNEELTTSKEEMQSLNEELQSVNHELQAKVDHLSLASDDMKNLLDSTAIATLFLDAALRVRRFTPQTTAIFKLIPGDAGRPITDLMSELDYPELADDARHVLRSLTHRQRDVTARSGRWFTVRIMPYRTQNDRVDGIVLTFVEITAGKALEATLRETLGLLQGRVSAQTAALDVAKSAESVLERAQAVLEERLVNQTAELRQAREDVQAERATT